MMNVKLQIISLLTSFFYGILFYLLILVNYNMLNNKKKLVKIVFNIIFIIDNVLLYSLMIYKINNGVFHIYYIIMMTIGFCLIYYLDRMYSLYVKVTSLIDLVSSYLYNKMRKGKGGTKGENK